MVWNLQTTPNSEKHFIYYRQKHGPVKIFAIIPSFSSPFKHVSILGFSRPTITYAVSFIYMSKGNWTCVCAFWTLLSDW